ncbi:MAG: VOC family protein [Candidatus Limnocylindrales bacterium]
MLLGIDHLVIAVADPDEAGVRLEQEIGLAAADGGAHPAMGTRNRLVWLGSSYIELLGIVDRDLAARVWIGAPVLEALARGGGLAAWAVATDGLDADLAVLRARRSDLGDPLAGERRRPDGGLVRWRFAAPRRLGPGEPPFLIEHDTRAAEWGPSDRAAHAAAVHPLGGPVRLAVLELPVDDVHRTGLRFTRALGLRFRPSLAGSGSRDADVGGQIVRLRPRRGGATSSVVHLAAPVPALRDAQLLGCRWILRPMADVARPPEPRTKEGT